MAKVKESKDLSDYRRHNGHQKINAHKKSQMTLETLGPAVIVTKSQVLWPIMRLKEWMALFMARAISKG